MFDLTRETRLTATEACRHPLMRRGVHPLNRSVLERWWTHGIRGPGGNRVVLESFRSGGLRMTTVEAVERFFHALNGGTVGATNKTKTQREHVAAERELAGAGI